MDETRFVTLLLTGLCVAAASSPNVYYFISKSMTWTEAEDYCLSEHTQMAHILDMNNATAMMNDVAGGYAHKAWTGLYGVPSEWTWVDGQPVTFEWWPMSGPNKGLCAYITDDGGWRDGRCSGEKAAACITDGGTIVLLSPTTWTNAQISCESKQSLLATVLDEKTNNAIRDKMKNQYTEAWIGLSRPTLWYWSDSEGNYTFATWQRGRPDLLEGEQICSSVVVKDGTWTEEQCSAKYPFFCYGIYKSRNTAVRIRIKTSANMEDPACLSDLEQQLQAATDFKLTWSILPVTMIQESSGMLGDRQKLPEKCNE